ncbi:MAG: curli production assembly/transport component CsgF [Rhodothermales bacterium]
MLRSLALALVALAFTARPAAAQEFVYQPTNPAFGGSYLNYSWLLSSAQAQNLYQNQSSSRFQRDPLADFEQSLQRQILSQLSREIVSDRFGGIDFTQEGRFDLGDFIIEITPGLNGLNVSIFNVLTGDESVVTVPNP